MDKSVWTERNGFMSVKPKGQPLKFLQEGVRFECQGTGRCCVARGEYGYIYFSLADRQRMAKVLGISTLQFTRQYCDKTDGWYHLKHPEKTCRFLDGKRCTVYEGRPTQCRTWPFWPENMNARTWNTEVKTFCAGVGKGRYYPPEEIVAILNQMVDNDEAP